jgi:hypothetical protein
MKLLLGADNIKMDDDGDQVKPMRKLEIKFNELKEKYLRLS